MITPEMIEIAGIIGGLLIVAAWTFETLEAVKKHKSLIDLRFSVVSLAGVIFLLFYAAMRNLEIYLWLQVALAIIIVFEIWYSIHVRKIHRRKIRRRK